jgi:xanthine dehydrogenase accessory factor
MDLLFYRRDADYLKVNTMVEGNSHKSEIPDRTYAVATVIRAERPTSAKAGAKATITADGLLTGWIGGSCAEPTVRREALKVIRDGQPRLIRLCPPEKMGILPQEGVTEVAMTCISGGTLEIYIEPVMFQPHLVVIGHLASAQALARLGKAMDFRVSVVGLEASHVRFPEADEVIDRLDLSSLDITSNSYIVVASHGNYDEDALEAALPTNAAYVALVASKARAEAILGYLRDSSLPEERVTQLKYPAGLDIGAITPEEIAISILAEIVQLRRRNPQSGIDEEIPEASTEEAAVAIDPVCNMVVEIESAHYTSAYQDSTYYFCCRGCQIAFGKEPEAYLSKLKE